MTTTCSCPCGESTFSLTGSPVLRFVCHCEICQKVYRKPYADLVLARLSQVVKPLDPGIQFAKHRPPPAVKRGLCPACKNPVLSLYALSPSLGMAFIPVCNLPEGMALPEPVLHAFYHRRVKDIDDDVLKVEGYWHSQWAISSRFLAGLRKQ